jgi:hypothetical protein
MRTRSPSPRVDPAQLTDPREFTLGIRMIILHVFDPTDHMRPAAGECDARSSPGLHRPPFLAPDRDGDACPTQALATSFVFASNITIGWRGSPAMYISRHHTKDSYPDLARAFGGKHHTTVISAVQKIIERVKDDASLRSEIHAIESIILR